MKKSFSEFKKRIFPVDNYTLLNLLITLGLFVLSLFVLLDTPLSLEKLESFLIPRTQAFARLPLTPSQSIEGVAKIPVDNIVDLNIPVPNLTADAVLARDLNSGKILYQKNIHARLAPASTTKLMTALVAMDYYRLTDVLTVYPAALVDGSSMNLRLNERLTFLDLLYGMLLNSGNDAAYTLAVNYPGGLPSFVSAMNQKALALGLKDTHFQNPAGFDDPTHFSSAYDLSIIAKEAMKNPILAKIVDTKYKTVISLDNPESSTSSKVVHTLKNLDELLSDPGVIGIKTGYTEKAGENFVGLVDREGHKVITVVLDSTDRFGDTKLLMDWVYKNYLWKME